MCPSDLENLTKQYNDANATLNDLSNLGFSLEFIEASIQKLKASETDFKDVIIFVQQCSKPKTREELFHCLQDRAKFSKNLHIIYVYY